MTNVSLHRLVSKRRATEPDLSEWIGGIGDRVKELRESAGLGMNELDRLIGQGSGYTTRLERGEKKNPALHIVAAYAKVLKVRVHWLVTGEGPREIPTGPGLVKNPPAGLFLQSVDRIPSLKKWLDQHPLDIHLLELAIALDVYENVKPASRSDGEPIGGWPAFFSDALSGRLTRPLSASQSEAEALELGQMSVSGRKRVRSALKKR